MRLQGQCKGINSKLEKMTVFEIGLKAALLENH